MPEYAPDRPRKIARIFNARSGHYRKSLDRHFYLVNTLVLGVNCNLPFSLCRSPIQRLASFSSLAWEGPHLS
jgi:hypothetical protein